MFPFRLNSPCHLFISDFSFNESKPAVGTVRDVLAGRGVFPLE